MIFSWFLDFWKIMVFGLLTKFGFWWIWYFCQNNQNSKNCTKKQ